MTDKKPDGRILLRVVSIVTELQSQQQSASSVSPPPTQMVQVVLIPAGKAAYDVLGGQKVTFHISDPLHPLLARLGIDEVFELAPVEKP